MGMEVWWGTDFHSFFYAQPLQWKYGCQGGGVGEDVSPAQLHNIENKKKAFGMHMGDIIGYRTVEYYRRRYLREE